jgi:hypothetical protein
MKAIDTRRVLGAADAHVADDDLGDSIGDDKQRRQQSNGKTGKTSNIHTTFSAGVVDRHSCRTWPLMGRSLTVPALPGPCSQRGLSV